MPIPEDARVDAAVEELTHGAGRLEGAPAAWTAPPLRRILVATDGSPPSQLAVAWARRIGVATWSRVVAVSVLWPSDVAEHFVGASGLPRVPGTPNVFKEQEARAQAALADASAELRGAGVEHETLLTEGTPAARITRLAEEQRADLVIVGSHGAGAVDRLLLGSVAEGVKNHARCSVLLAKTLPPPRRILLPTDGSRASKRAVGLGLRLGAAWGTPATLLHVLPLSHGIPEAERRRHEAAAADLDLSWTTPRATAAVAFGNPADRITAAAREDVGLVVMGSRGLGGLQSLVTGSVGYRVSHEAPASVLLVKEAKE